jgi:hypothetical protein
MFLPKKYHFYPFIAYSEKLYNTTLEGYTLRSHLRYIKAQRAQFSVLKPCTAFRDHFERKKSHKTRGLFAYFKPTLVVDLL